MNTRRLLVLGALLLAILWIVGCATGAIVASMRGTDTLVPVPGIHLPAQMITGEHKGQPVEGGNSFVLTNTILSSIIASIVLILLFALGTRRLNLVPGRLQSLLEAIVEGLLGFIEGIVGPARARQLFPLVATIFLFVMFNAWLGLLPLYQSLGISRYETVTLAELDRFEPNQRVGTEELRGIVAKRLEAEGEEREEAISKAHVSKLMITDEGELSRPLSVEAHQYVGTAASRIEQAGGHAKQVKAGLTATLLRPAGTDMNMPLALALISFVLVEGLGLRLFNVGYLSQFLPVKRVLRGDVMSLFVGVLEIISHFIRVVSFTFRLFGNMTAGEILVLLMGFLASFVIPAVFYGVELFVGFIQAFIFAGLTVVFAAVALTPHEGEGQEQHGEQHH